MRLLERRLAVVLDPAVLPEEGGGEAEREAELEREAVDTRGEEDRNPTCDWSIVRSWGSNWSIRKLYILNRLDNKNIYQGSSKGKLEVYNLT